MKVKRRLNKELLRNWLDRNQPHPREKLVQACDYAFSVYLLDKMLGHGLAPKLNNRMRIVKATGIPMDDLFPEVKRKSA